VQRQGGAILGGLETERVGLPSPVRSPHGGKIGG
jgi:hypothetical protein